jgi:hypothetical protein
VLAINEVKKCHDLLGLSVARFRNDRHRCWRVLISITLVAIAGGLGAHQYLRLRRSNTALPTFLIEGKMDLASIASAWKAAALGMFME